MVKAYEIIDHTADVGLKVYGKTLSELFENAALGMFSIIAGKDLLASSRPSTKKKIQIKKQVETYEELLVEWLGEILYIFNKEQILFKSFKILQMSLQGIRGEASGERIDFSKAPLETEIKAVTFHGLKIEQDKTGFSTTIIFDV